MNIHRKKVATVIASLMMLTGPVLISAAQTSGATHIHDIQGASHISPLKGKAITNVSGIVTAIAPNGFYLQDPTPDNSDDTSEGIFVFTRNKPKVGDSLLVGGTVQEFQPGGKSGTTNLTGTELAGKVSVKKISSGNALPTAIVIGIGGRVPPDKVIEDDATGDVETSGTFDPASDGIDFYESLEGMRVQINDAVAVGPTNQYGEVFVVGDDGQKATTRTPRGGIISSLGDFNPERMMVSDYLIKPKNKMPVLNVGDKFTQPIVGVLSYDFGNYEVLPTGPVQTASGGLTQETTQTATSDQLTVGEFNVENLSPADPTTKFTTLASLIVTNLKAPDILVVEEIQDNSGPQNNGTVAADQTFARLIAAIKTAGGPTYDYRQIDPENNKDGGQPGGNIREGFLFNPARVQFVDHPGGTATTDTTVSGSARQVTLSFSPGRIDPQNAAWNSSRKPLAGQFTFNGSSVIIIANHFVSKLGDQPLFGHSQPPRLSSEDQRTQQARVVHTFVQSTLDIDPNANIIVVGDLNDFEYSNPIEALKGTLLDNLIETLPTNERYSYVYEGNSEVLDQMLVSHNLFKNAEYDIVHINAEFAVQSSDHDPAVARFEIK